MDAVVVREIDTYPVEILGDDIIRNVTSTSIEGNPCVHVSSTVLKTKICDGDVVCVYFDDGPIVLRVDAGGRLILSDELY